jgi:adenine phosphoribosyltransferase
LYIIEGHVNNYLDLIDTTTIGRRYDVTPIFGNHQAFTALLDDLMELCREIEYDTVAAIDALGFILGTAIAVRSEKPLVPIRKGGKLPVEVQKASFIDYTGKGKSLEIRYDALSSQNRVLLVDEWIETAAQVKAAIGLIEGQGAEVAAVLSIVIDESPTIRELRDRYPILALAHDL